MPSVPTAPRCDWTAPTAACGRWAASRPPPARTWTTTTPSKGYPLTSRVLKSGVIESVDTEDPTADPAETELLRRDGMRGLVMLPLIAKGQAIGLIELVSTGPPNADPGQITLATTMTHEAAMALENARLYETARNLADRDPLTGFFNHRYLHERLAEEVVRAVRAHRPLSVVMLDLDDFKLVNDSFGHLYGDGVLVHVAERIRSSLRASDVPARYGGDEFALILPETTCEDAAGVAARILAAFRDSPFSSDGRVPFPIGASIGIATYPEEQRRSATDLLAVADRGLYNAKAAGGNRVGPDPEAVVEVDVDADVEAPIELGAHRRRIGEPLARPAPVGEPLEAPVQSSGA